MPSAFAPVLAHLLMAGLVRRAQLSQDAQCGTALGAAWGCSPALTAAGKGPQLATPEETQAARPVARAPRIAVGTR
jgi:hypothetical protein